MKEANGFPAAEDDRALPDELALSICGGAQTSGAACAVIDAMPFMLALFDAEGRYIFCNKKYTELSNPARTTWRGAHITEYLPDKTVEQIRPRLQRLFKGERVSFHLDLEPEDGLARTILVNYVPIVSSSGAPLFLMIGQDATALKTAERRLFAAQNLETLGQLTGGVAHDFNNNIGVISGTLSVMAMSTDNPVLAGQIERCRQAADRCAKLTAQMLAFARRQPLQRRAIFARRHLHAIEDLLTVSIAPNIECRVIDTAPDAAIFVDPTQFENAIMNLVINARDAMPDGGLIAITISTVKRKDIAADIASRIDPDQEAHEEYVRITIADEGCGMTPEIAARAFDPFVTTKSDGQGSGMGLAMVQGFVKQSGGFVAIETVQGKGTSVDLWLPRSGETVDHAPASRQIAAPVQRQLVILVVEDDDDMATVICEMLHVMGHATYRCDNAEAALHLLRETSEIDIVLTDIMLRGGASGIALRAEIAKEFPHIRVICASGYQDDNARRGYEADAKIEFIAKPFDYDELAERLNPR
ncbi:MAG: response regulator [Hyphomicrobiales bacterium]|nr:response regulator [Hyphomicrobiales bacterium]